MDTLRWDGVSQGRWNLVAAAVQGPSHRLDDTPCQDAFAFSITDDRLVAVVSDGAGSAARAAEGSRITADRMVAGLSALTLDPAADGVEAWRPAVERVIEDLRAGLATLSDNGDIADFHATLVAVVAGPAGGLFIHIGDGMAHAADAALAPVGHSVPVNGEEANSTYFVTLPFWRETLRLTPFGPFARIILMTDGPMPFAAAKKGVGLEPAFMRPVDGFLSTHPVAEGAEALAGTLDGPDARRISTDDKTILWAALA